MATSTDGFVDLYDSEVEKVGKLLGYFNDLAQSTRISYQDFTDRVKDKFAELGLDADVVWWETQVPGVLIPEIQVKGRLDPNFQWDPERMSREVITDVLGTGEAGAINMDGKIISPSKKTSLYIPGQG